MSTSWRGYVSKIRLKIEFNGPQSCKAKLVVFKRCFAVISLSCSAFNNGGCSPVYYRHSLSLWLLVRHSVLTMGSLSLANSCRELSEIKRKKNKYQMLTNTCIKKSRLKSSPE